MGGETKEDAIASAVLIWNIRPIEDALRDHITELSIELIPMGEEEIVIDALRTDIACLQVALEASEDENARLRQRVDELLSEELMDGAVRERIHLRFNMHEVLQENERLQKMFDWLAEENADSCRRFLPFNPILGLAETWKEAARRAVA